MTLTEARRDKLDLVKSEHLMRETAKWSAKAEGWKELISSGR